jgi:alpha-methylacyl-CoA racemase
MSAPLSGLRVIEIAGLGPAPYCAMLLADLGADVIRVDRAGAVTGSHDASSRHDLLNRGKRSIGVDLKRPDGVAVVLDLAAGADVFIEGFRPGVVERLGIGPEPCLERNRRLVYGRMTGWGQDGPLAPTAGHDIAYLALSGALHPIGIEEKPIPPLNLCADFGGGGLFLAVGVLAALRHVAETGEGQVVDAAMVDGAAHLTSMFHGMLAAGVWSPRRRANLLDGGAPFYDTYETADGNHVAVGALEPQFYSELLAVLGIDDDHQQMDRDGWIALRRRMAEVFRTRTRDEWEAAFAGTDACVAPVLSLVEAPHHPHNRARGTFVVVDGVTQPGLAPRFSAAADRTPGRPVAPGADSEAILAELGLSDAAKDRLRASGAVR